MDHIDTPSMSATTVMLASFGLYALPFIHFGMIKIYYGSLPHDFRFMSYKSMFFALSALGVSLTFLLSFYVIEPTELVEFSNSYAKAYSTTSQPTFNPNEIMTAESEIEQNSNISDDASDAFMYLTTHLMVLVTTYHVYKTK